MTRRSLILSIALVLAGVAVAHGDAAKPDNKKLLLGKWQLAAQKDVTVEFLRDGKVVVAMAGSTEVVRGTYRWIDHETLEATLDDGKGAKTERVKVAFDGNDTVSTTDKKGNVEKFLRVK